MAEKKDKASSEKNKKAKSSSKNKKSSTNKKDALPISASTTKKDTSSLSAFKAKRFSSIFSKIKKDVKKEQASSAKTEKTMEELEQENIEAEKKQLEKTAKNNFKLALAMGKDNPTKAIEYFESSRKAEEELHGGNSSNVALVYEKIAEVYQNIEEPDLALENYEKALAIFHNLETSENYKGGEERQQMLEMKTRISKNLIEVNKYVSRGTGKSEMLIPMEITLGDSSGPAKSRKPLYRQTYNLLSDTGSVSTATGTASLFSDNYSLLTPQSQIPLNRKKIHPKEEEKLGDVAEEEGDLTKAVEHYKYALNTLARKRKQDNRSVLRLQIKIADTFLREGAFFQAIKVYSSIAEHVETKRKNLVFFLNVMVPPHSALKKRVPSDFLKDIFEIEKKGDDAFKKGLENGRFMDAAVFYNRALKILYKDKSLKPGNKHILRVHVKLGNIKWMMDENGDIANAYDKAVSYFLRKGDTLLEKNDTAGALYCYAQAMRFLFKIVKPNNEQVLRLQMKVADVLFSEGESLGALSLYRDVTNYVEAEAEFADTDLTFYREVLNQTITTHEDVGEACILENNAEGALFHFEEVLKFLTVGKWEAKETKLKLVQRAKTLEKIGDVHIMLKHYDKAEEAYAKANKLRSGETEVEIKSFENPKDAAAESASNFYKIGYTYESMENYEKAMEFYDKAVSLRQEYFGPLDPVLAKYFFSVNSVKEKCGQIEEAFTGLSRVLVVLDQSEPSGSIVSIEHVNTLKLLASISLRQGNKQLAFNYYVQQLDKLQYCRSTTLRDFIDVLHNMGDLLISVGYIKEALKYYELELQMREKISHGNEDVLADINQEIGNCYAALGIHDKALEHYQRGLYDDAAAKENLMVYNKIGIQLAKLEKYEESLKFHQTSVLYLQAEEDEDVIKMAYNNLANAYQGIMNYDKAKETYDLIPEQIKSKNDDIPSYTLYNMGNLFQHKGLIEKAKKCFDEFIGFADQFNSGSKEFWENQAIKANALNNKGNILLEEGQYEECTEQYKNALILKKEVFGKDSKEVFGTLCNLGSVMYKLRMIEYATKYYELALQVALKANCGDPKQCSLNQASVLHKLGNVSYMEKEYDTALDFYKRSYVIKSRVYQDDAHADVLLTRNNIGLLLLKQKRYDDAEILFKDVYEKMKKYNDEQSPEVGRVLLDIAEAHIGKNELEECKDLCIKAMLVFENANLSLKHPYPKHCRKILAKAIKRFLNS